jgi:2-oxo-4-hydroxy-4-carboxy--5-ureidoimidazoline (OHCU) decarboxylase
MEALADRVLDYPFLTVLATPIQEIRDLSGKEYTFYLTDLFEKSDMLLDLKEDMLDPVFRFMSGPPKAIYDEARSLLQEQEANLSYVESDAPQQIAQVLKDHACFKNNRMQQVKAWVDALRKDMTARVEEERTKARDSVEFLKDRMAIMSEYQEISPEHQDQLNLPFATLIQEVERQNLIAVIRDRLRRFEDTEYQKLLAQMCEFNKLATEDTGPVENDGRKEAKEPKIDYISGKKIRVCFAKPWLADEADVDSYLAEVKKALMKEITAGKRIHV